MYLKNYDISCLISSFAKSNSLFWYYIKQIMNVFIRAVVRIFSFISLHYYVYSEKKAKKVLNAKFPTRNVLK